MRLGLLVLFAASAFAQAKPDAAEILAKVKDTLKDIKSYDLDLEITVRDSTTGLEQSSGVRVASAIEPERYRVVYSGDDASGPEGTMIYDGSIFTVYLPVRNEYRTDAIVPDKLGRDAKPSKVNSDTGIGQYVKLVERFASSHLLREESISNGGGAPADCYLIEKETGGKMWIDKSNYHILRAEEIDPDGTSSVAVIGLKLNEPLSDDLFKFVPPPGARNLGKP
ncbi:MAG TPA: DUF2092 domain-containing protein [Bryobacteraceae bacterium]|jgi:outer membrane lipoprotein-sorting protein